MNLQISIVCLPFILWGGSIAHWIVYSIEESPFVVLQWWFSQWVPFESISLPLEQQCWDQMQSLPPVNIIDLPEINVQEHGDDVLGAIERKYGPTWRSKPLLFRSMWTLDELDSDDNRRLSLKGLLNESMIVPYFTNVSRPNALVPDATGRISDIVANISSKSLPHKIGTQLLAQRNPEIVYEVAPNQIMTQIFGNYFTPAMVRGFLNGLLPAITVIPLFIAKANFRPVREDGTASCSDRSLEQPRTDMHCEPIANIMVQLEGAKQITLISPQYSLQLQPRTSPDGRAYIYSMTPTFEHVPRYVHLIQKGDAIYIPTWTWHRVDYNYDDDESIAISGSLFHFRPLDFVWRNPLHAAVILPNLLKELAGLKMQ